MTIHDNTRTGSLQQNVMTTIWDALVIVLFMCALILPAAAHLTGMSDTGYIQETEKRAPNPWPGIPRTVEEITSFPGKVNAFLNDHFGFRSRLVTLNNRFYLALGTSTSEKVIKGNNGWLYYTGGDMVDQYRGLHIFQPDELRRWIRAMEERKAWLAEKGTPFIIAVPPNKMTIYPEHLPDWMTKVSPITRIDQLADAVADTGLDFIDLRDPVRQAKTEFPVYYMTDSHWNFHGGFIGYKRIMDGVQAYFPQVEILRDQDVDLIFHTGPGKDLSGMLNLTHALKEPYEDRVVLKKRSRVQSVTVLGDDGFPKIVTTDRDGAPTVLIFRDSYTINMEPYFNETFKKIIYDKYDNLRFSTRLIDQYRPDLVLLVVIERALRFRPYNPPGVNSGGLSIANWGPCTVRAKERFNPQPNRMSAMWIVGQNISADTVILWDGVQLDTRVNTEKSVLTAFVPDDLLDTPGRYPVRLQDTGTGESSEAVFFEVTE